MKISEINLKNFRVYKNESIKVNKEMILLYGNNGLGKTSFFDAIEWGITGKLERYEGPNDERNRNSFLKNTHSGEEDEGVVIIKFTDGNFIERKIQKKKSSDYNTGFTESLIEDILIKKEFKSEQIEIKDDFIPLHLLSQTLLDSFIRNKKSSERYDIFIKMFGLNKYKKIQEIINGNINIVTGKKDKIEDKIKNLEEKIQESSYKRIQYEEKKFKKLTELRLEDISIHDIIKSKDEILEKNIIIHNSKKLEVKEIGSKLEEIENLLDETKRIKKMKDIYSKKQNYEIYIKLKKLNLEEKKNILSKETHMLEKIKSDSFIEKIKFLKLIKEEKKWNLLNKRLKYLKNELIELKNDIDKIIKNKYEFITSTIVYLNNLDNIENCPLCGNSDFILEKVIKILNHELKKDNTELDNMVLLKNEKIKKLEDLRNVLIEKVDSMMEKKIKLNKLKLNKLEKDIKKSVCLKYNFLEIEANLKELKLENIDDIKKFLNYSYIQEEFLIKEKINLKNELENFIPKKINLIDLKNGKLEEIETELQNDERELLIKIKRYLINLYLSSVKDQKKLKDLKKEQEIKISLLNSLEEFNKDIKTLISDSLIKNSMKRQKSIQKIYKSITPHYNFKNFNLVFKEYTKKNNGMEFCIEDKNSGVKANPAYLFSSAQNNLLALSIFLSFSCQEKWSKLDSIFLDDPIQCLDDINIYSFIDILISISKKANKQIFISTHDENIKNLLEKKIGKNKLQIIELDNYGKFKIEGE